MSDLLGVLGASAIAILAVLSASKAKTAGQVVLVFAVGGLTMGLWISLFHGGIGFAELADWLGDVLLREEAR